MGCHSFSHGTRFGFECSHSSKTKAPNWLPGDFNLPLTQTIVTPYAPVPDMAGEE